jgi:outer membrane protein assembly factor BamB
LTIKKHRVILKIYVLVSIVFCHVSWSQNWPQWRGPNRDGHVETFAVPTAWPDSLKQIWRVEAGPGLSSPVVAEGKIYLLTRDGDDEVVSCYQLADGNRIWQQRYPARFIPNPQAIRSDLFPVSRGKGPFATPVIQDGYLYTLGVDRVLSCFEAKSGALKWRQHYMKQSIPDKLVYECPQCGCSEDGKEFSEGGLCSACRMPLGAKNMETSASFNGGNYYGTSASPIIVGKIGIVNIGNLDAGALIAFDLKNGAEKWRWQGPPPSSSSPIITELHGTRQVVVLTRENLAGIEVSNGQQLWNYAIESNAQIVTPIVFEDLVIFSAYRSPTTAVRIKKAGKVWSAEQAWNTNEITLYTSTPVLIGDKLFGLSYSQRGQFFGMEARTGKKLWASEGRQAEGAAILSAGGNLLALTNEAKLMVLKNNETAHQPLANYTVAKSSTWAHPVVWNKNILVKDESALTLWRME